MINWGELFFFSVPGGQFWGYLENYRRYGDFCGELFCRGELDLQKRLSQKLAYLCWIPRYPQKTDKNEKYGYQRKSMWFFGSISKTEVDTRILAETFSLQKIALCKKAHYQIHPISPRFRDIIEKCEKNWRNRWFVQSLEIISKTTRSTEILVITFLAALTLLYKKGPHQNSRISVGFQDIAKAKDKNLRKSRISESSNFFKN